MMVKDQNDMAVEVSVEGGRVILTAGADPWSYNEHEISPAAARFLSRELARAADSAEAGQ